MNVGHGRKICIRLRPHYDEGRFFDFNDLIGTMLHEYAMYIIYIYLFTFSFNKIYLFRLTHIEIGPHDARFYKLLDELNDEYDVLLIKGFSDEGFFGNGYRLGQGISHNVSPALARQKALEEAEKRRKIEGLMTKGGRRLGGGDGYGLPLRELAAMAAERRRRDGLWCGSEGINNNNNSSGTSSVVKERSTTTRPISGRIPPNKIPGLSKVNATARIPADKLPGTSNSLNSWETIEWTCSQCTFINRPMSLQCEICSVERPHTDNTSFSSPQPVIIIDDDNSSDPFSWSCPRCTFNNASDIIMCLGCDYLRN
jgi:DNA-dependent metalloprotease WSS1